MAGAPPTRRSRARTRARALALVAALVVTAACGDDEPAGDAAPAGGGVEGDGEATSGTLELAPSTTTTTTPEDLALSELLPADVPFPGFERADDVLGAGPLDLEAAAAAEADVDAERSLLETRGFERGASRAWVDAAQDVAYVAVYEFATAEGATAYLADGIETLEARDATGFDVTEVEGAQGFTTVEESPEGSFTAHAVAFARGERWVLALVGSAGSARTADDAHALASAQAALLP